MGDPPSQEEGTQASSNTLRRIRGHRKGQADNDSRSVRFGTAGASQDHEAHLDDSFFKKFRNVGLDDTLSFGETDDDMYSFRERSVSVSCQRLAEGAGQEPLLNAYQHVVEAIVNSATLSKENVASLSERVQRMFGISQRLHSSVLIQAPSAASWKAGCHRIHLDNFLIKGLHYEARRDLLVVMDVFPAKEVPSKLKLSTAPYRTNPRPLTAAELTLRDSVVIRRQEMGPLVIKLEVWDIPADGHSGDSLGGETMLDEEAMELGSVGGDGLSTTDSISTHHAPVVVKDGGGRHGGSSSSLLARAKHKVTKKVTNVVHRVTSTGNTAGDSEVAPSSSASPIKPSGQGGRRHLRKDTRIGSCEISLSQMVIDQKRHLTHSLGPGLSLDLDLSYSLLDELHVRYVVRHHHQALIQHTIDLLIRGGRMPAAAGAQGGHWDGQFSSSQYKMFKASGDWANLSPLQQAIDLLHGVLEATVRSEVHPGGVHDALSSVEVALRTPGIELGQYDEQRLCASLKAASSWCLLQANSPLAMFDPLEPEAAPDRLRFVLQSLKLLMTIDVWQNYCTAERVAAVYKAKGQSNPLAAENRLMACVKDLVQVTKSTSYLRIKTRLIEEFGEELVEKLKRQISDVLIENLGEEQQRAIVAKHHRSELMKRLHEILASNKKITYTRVKSALVREFGPSNFERHRSQISAELAAKSAGRAMTTEYKGWDLRRELSESLQGAAEVRYRGIHELCKPDKEYASWEVVQLVKTCRSLRSDMTKVWSHFQEVYTLVGDDFSLYDEMISWYDSLFSTDLRELLARWCTHNTQDGPEVIVFELYYIVRDFWQDIKLCATPKRTKELRLLKHPQWFEPFVLQWMSLSRVNADKWVSNALEFDTWEPIREEQLFSTSVLDVFRVVYEILSFWERLEWQDREAAEEHLFTELATSICGCIRTFTRFTVERIQQQRDAAMGQRGQFSDGAVCTGLNNLAEASKQLSVLREEVSLDAVAESHLTRARRLIEGHSGSVLEHRAVGVFRATEAALTSGMQIVTADVAGVIRPRLLGDLTAVVAQYVKDAEANQVSPSAFATTALSGLLDEGEPDGPVEPEESSRATAGRWLQSLAKNLRKKHRRATKADSLQQDGYLNTLLLLFAAELQYEETVNMVAADVFEVLLGCLADVLLEYNAEEQREKVVPLMGALLSELQQFFNAESEGVSMDTLNACADRVLKPLLRSCLYDVEDLMTKYYQCCGEHFGKVIRQASGIALGSRVDEASGRDILASRAVSATPTFSGANVRLRLSQRGIGGSKLSIEVLEVTGAPAGPTYVVFRVMPSFERKPYKAKTSSKSPTSKNRVAFDEVVTLTHVKGGVCLEVRVKVGGTKISKGATIGEAMIPVADLQEFCVGRSITVPLNSLVHHGRISQLQYLIKQRASMHPDAKHFVSEYPHLRTHSLTKRFAESPSSPTSGHGSAAHTLA